MVLFINDVMDKVKHPKEVVEKEQEVRILGCQENRRISLGLSNWYLWPELIDYFESGKEVSDEIIRILDKGIITAERDVEGIIPFGKMSKR